MADDVLAFHRDEHVATAEVGIELRRRFFGEVEQRAARRAGRRTARSGLVRAESCATLLVATAAADVDNLRFYQRLGVRMTSIERDAFTVATGYPTG